MIDPMHDRSPDVNRFRHSRASRAHRLSYSSLAIWMVPLLLLIAMLIFSFGESQPTIRESLHITSLQPGLEFARVADSDGPLPAAGEESVRAPSAAIRDQVLQRLRRFRADYKQAAPSIRVAANAANPRQAQLASTITGLLATASLNQQLGAQDVARTWEGVETALIIRGSGQDRQMVYRLLQALSPLLSGGVVLAFEGGQNTGRVDVIIRGEPRFTANGVAVFPDSRPLARPVPADAER